jgi:hypothetical protein
MITEAKVTCASSKTGAEGRFFRPDFFATLFQSRVQPYHVCHLKPVFGHSYLIFKEEILSLRPYVSVFYDVVSDREIQDLICYAQDRVCESCLKE